MTDTKTLILDTAERLFAEKGIEAVSVRAILAEAGLNVALAHYHFGSREGLIREVLRRRIAPINEERLELLAQAEAEAAPGKPSLDVLLRGFFGPTLRILDESPSFGRLAGHIHNASDDNLRQLYASLFMEVLRRYSDAITEALPASLSPSQRLCRGHFTIGAMVHTLANYRDMVAMARGRYEVPRGEELVEELVEFCTAGLLAPVELPVAAADGQGATDPRSDANPMTGEDSDDR
jgi:AcrR family transcriptional regulator